MNLFDLTPAAEYFCRPLAAPPAVAPQSVKALVESFQGVTHLREGDPRFETYRISLLSSIERWLLYSAAHYRRALEMLVPASAPWAHVTLYYSSFFAANAILGMFGGWVKTEGRRTVMDVVTQTPGSQELRIARGAPLPTLATGSHGAFWAFFYDAAPRISPWAPVTLRGALTPPTSTVWQSNTRNDVNYDMFFAFEASRHFQTGFDSTNFPATVTGNLGQQLETTERMLELAASFARDLSLESFAINGLVPGGSRLKNQRRLVRMTPPNVVKQSALQRVLAV